MLVNLQGRILSISDKEDFGYYLPEFIQEKEENIEYTAIKACKQTGIIVSKSKLIYHKAEYDNEAKTYFDRYCFLAEKWDGYIAAKNIVYVKWLNKEDLLNSDISKHVEYNKKLFSAYNGYQILF